MRLALLFLAEHCLAQVIRRVTTGRGWISQVIVGLADSLLIKLGQCFLVHHHESGHIVSRPGHSLILKFFDLNRHCVVPSCAARTLHKLEGALPSEHSFTLLNRALFILNRGVQTATLPRHAGKLFSNWQFNHHSGKASCDELIVRTGSLRLPKAFDILLKYMVNWFLQLIGRHGLDTAWLLSRGGLDLPDVDLRRLWLQLHISDGFHH